MKVAVERRRRDRINRSLESLRLLLSQDVHTGVEADQVLDKAVVLEKTVELLVRVRDMAKIKQGRFNIIFTVPLLRSSKHVSSFRFADIKKSCTYSFSLFFSTKWIGKVNL